jgi:hypothetical protein
MRQEKKMPAALLRFRSAIAAAATAAALGCARAEEAADHAAEKMAPRRQCFSTEQTREKIETHKLTDPFVSMRAAARQLGGEALGGRLCRLEEALIYEISVFRPDGRIVKI